MYHFDHAPVYDDDSQRIIGRPFYDRIDLFFFKISFKAKVHQRFVGIVADELLLKLNYHYVQCSVIYYMIKTLIMQPPCLKIILRSIIS